MVSKTEETFIKLIKSKKPSLPDLTSFLRNNPSLNLNTLDSHGYNILHYAIKQEKSEIVNLLFTISSDPSSDPDHPILPPNPNTLTNDLTNNIHTSPLFLSLLHLNDTSISDKIIKTLLRNGADLSYTDEDKCTLFHKCCEKGRTELLSFLLNKNPSPININTSISDLGSGMHLAIIGQQDDIITLLLDNHIDLSIVDKQGNTALHLALIEKQMNQFKQILDYVIETKIVEVEKKKEILNTQNKEGNNVLHELAFARTSVLMDFVRKKIPKEFAVEEDVRNKEGLTYEGVAEKVIELERRKVEEEKKMKEENRRRKEEVKRLQREEEERMYEKQKEYERKMERQAEFGNRLMEYRGVIFILIFLLFMGFMFIVMKNASKKKEIIL